MPIQGTILETQRLTMRELKQSDFDDFCKILQDKETMYAYEGAFSDREAWHQGYATEAAIACRQYAFDVLGADEVCSIIRDTNLASQHVAIRNGMTPTDTFVKHYRGVDMPRTRYIVRKSEDQA